MFLHYIIGLTALLSITSGLPNFKFLHSGCNTTLDGQERVMTVCQGPISTLDLSVYNESAVLVLEDLNLLTLSPSNFTSYTNLQELRIHGSLISDPFTPVKPNPVWQGYIAFKNLTVLDLSNNRLGALEAKGFKYLAKVAILNLTGNALTALPASMTSSMTSLTTLVLDGNPLESLPCGTLKGATSLTTLSLRSSQITTLLGCEFTSLTLLKSLDLSGGELTTVAPGTFSALTSLITLDLSSNKITSFVWDGPSKKSSKSSKVPATDTAPSLQTLSLEDNKLTDLGPFTTLTSLRTLKISRNYFTALSPSMFTGLTYLEKLFIQSCPELTTVEPLTFAGLTNLIILDMEGNPMLSHIAEEQFSAEQIALEIILLANNNITTLAKSTFTTLANLAMLRITDNALYCDCNARWIKEEYASPKYTWSKTWAADWPTKGGPTCTWPLNGMPLILVPADIMTCIAATTDDITTSRVKPSPTQKSLAEPSPTQTSLDKPPGSTEFVVPAIPRDIKVKAVKVEKSSFMGQSSMTRNIIVGFGAFVAISMTTWFIVYKAKEEGKFRTSRCTVPPSETRTVSIPILNRGYQYVYKTFD